MKHLKKFYESIDLNIKEIIDDCLTYVSDETYVVTTIDDLEGSAIITIYLKKENKENINELVIAKEKNVNILQNTIIAISRLEDITKGKVNFMENPVSNYITFILNIKNQNFFIKNEKYIILIKELLLKKMQIEGNPDMNISSDGLYQYLEIEFKNINTFNLNSIVKSRNYLKDIKENITILNEPIFKSINVSEGREYTYYINDSKTTKEKWGITLKLNKKYNYSIK
jgi:hypothetical protein